MLSTTQQGPWRVHPTSRYRPEFGVEMSSGDPIPDHDQAQAMIEGAPDLMRSVLGLLAIFDSTTMGEERDLKLKEIPRAREALMKCGLVHVKHITAKDLTP